MTAKQPAIRQKTGNSTSFKPGQSGNLSGRPKKTQEQQNALEAIRNLAPEASQVLHAVMSDPRTPPAARLKAVEMVLDRTYGKPDMAVKVEDPKNDAISDIRAEVAKIKAAVAGD